MTSGWAQCLAGTITAELHPQSSALRKGPATAHMPINNPSALQPRYNTACMSPEYTD